jgi:starvation-inducible DNA-binding protein
MKTLVARSRFALSEDVRHRAAHQLQSVLVDILDLDLQTKQAHWNLRGPNFVGIHKMLDEFHATYQETIDQVAERILALGFPADGRAATIERGTNLDVFPEGFIEDHRAISILADHIGVAATKTRETQEAIGPIDAVSEDILIELLQNLEKHLWMLQSQEN